MASGVHLECDIIRRDSAHFAALVRSYLAAPIVRYTPHTLRLAARSSTGTRPG
jgi:hypothetical protein